MADSPECPPLTGSNIDFDALHAAAKGGEDLKAHIAAQAAGTVPAPEPAEPATAKRGKADAPAE